MCLLKLLRTIFRTIAHPRLLLVSTPGKLSSESSQPTNYHASTEGGGKTPTTTVFSALRLSAFSLAFHIRWSVPPGPEYPSHFPGPSRDLKRYRDDVTLMHNIRGDSVATALRDRMVLLYASSGEPGFFLGSDSAPHLAQPKKAWQEKQAALLTPFYSLSFIHWTPPGEVMCMASWTIDS